MRCRPGAAALWRLPSVGSCIAAGLGAGWMGAAAAGVIGLVTMPDRIAHRLGHIVARFFVGVCLLAPLWAYIKLMQMQPIGTIHT